MSLPANSDTGSESVPRHSDSSAYASAERSKTTDKSLLWNQSMAKRVELLYLTLWASLRQARDSNWGSAKSMRDG
jgi:hypothetical protein